MTRLQPVRDSVLATALAAAPLAGCYAGAPRVEPGSADTEGGEVDGAGEGGECRPIPRRIVRLTPLQLARTYAAVLGDDAVDVESFAATIAQFSPVPSPFSTRADVLSVSAGYVEALFYALEAAVGRALEAPSVVDPCIDAGPDDACVTRVLERVGARVKLRPLTEGELEALRATFRAAQPDAVDDLQALSVALRRLLIDPEVLFRTELGDESAASLTPSETAAVLAHLISHGPPSAELRAAAPEDRATLAAALLEQPQTGAGLTQFLVELSHGSDRGHPDQPEELERFIEHVLWSDDATFEALLTADYTVVDRALAEHYWADAEAEEGWRRVQPPEPRAGLLTQGAVLSRFTNVSARGNFIRELLLCEPPLQIPDDVPSFEQTAEQFEEENGRPPTERELRELHLADPSCSGCHALIDPLGQPLHGFDALGRPRDSIDGEPVEVRGAVVGTSEPDRAVDGAQALGQALAQSPHVRACFVRRLYEYSVGYAPTDADACAVDVLTERFEASGGDLKQLVVDLVASESFVARTR